MTSTLAPPDAPTAEDRLGWVDALDPELIAFTLTYPDSAEAPLTLDDADQEILLYRVLPEAVPAPP